MANVRILAALLGLGGALVSALPAAAQGYVYCTAWGAERRHFYSDLFQGDCEPVVTRQNGQVIRLQGVCKEGAPPAPQFRAYLTETYGPDSVDLVECFEDGPAQAKRTLEAEQRRDKDGGDNPILTGWKPG